MHDTMFDAPEKRGSRIRIEADLVRTLLETLDPARLAVER